MIIGQYGELYYHSNVWGHLEMSLFLKEKHILCPLKYGSKKDLSSETRQSILVLRNEGYSMQEIAKKLKISYNAVYYSLHRTVQTGSNQNRKRSGTTRCTTE
jgi:DNA-binding NarL/FixJ family response regulator